MTTAAEVRTWAQAHGYNTQGSIIAKTIRTAWEADHDDHQPVQS